MKVQPTEIRWHTGLPVFAKEAFLRAVGDAYGWLGGYADSGELRCVLPYTIIRRSFLRLARFRVETLPFAADFGIAEEREFLNRAGGFLRSIGADMIIPAASNAIFRTYPEKADAAPYGTYVIDLAPPEETLWKNVDRITRQNIRAASKAGVVIREASATELDGAYALIRETFRRSRLPFMDRPAFGRFVAGLGENGKILVADHQGQPQSYAVFGSSDYSAYAIYAGNASGLAPGANKLLYWEAIRLFKKAGARAYDFYGTRIDPEPGSKQEALGLFKKRFGATLRQGYIWKQALHAWKGRIYHLAARFRSGGDIVDAERHKLERFRQPMDGGS